jgi:hypothetical protein
MNDACYRTQPGAAGGINPAGCRARDVALPRGAGDGLRNDLPRVGGNLNFYESGADRLGACMRC